MAGLPGMRYDEPFFPGATYDASIPTPDSILGFPVGSRPATHAQIEAVVRVIAQTSPRARLVEYARSFEGRALYTLILASPANLERLDAIRADLGRLADPRTCSSQEGDRLAQTLPAVAWMAYVIHGDEMSGSDAALALAHHLAASQDADVKAMLDEVIVVIDPLMNPDGRDRWLAMQQQNRTASPSVDDQSLLHTGFWPSGRMNHYLFDLNRDWLFATQPESRGRIVAAGAWYPHFFMESHEMGPQDTFLFSPPREPINPHVPANVHKWWPIFAADQAAAFDARGWRYYTGEWNEEWYPGYSAAWAGFRGAIDVLYEQASISVDAVRRQEGTLQTYREAVHHQLVSSLANLRTLQVNRKAVLKDYLADRREVVAADGPYAQRVWAILPTQNLTRLRAFLDLLSIQRIEVHQTRSELRARGLDVLGRRAERVIPAGAYLIANRQAEGRFAAAALEFDPRMSPEVLEAERREVLRYGRSRVYDITAWSLPLLYGLDVYELQAAMPADAQLVTQLPAGTGRAASAPTGRAPVAWIVDGDDDASVAVAARLMEHRVRVRVAERALRLDDQDAPRGSVVVVRKDNLAEDGELAAAVENCATEFGTSVRAVQSGLGPGDLPDLGGGHFRLLEPPRIAVLGRGEFSAYSFGELWYLLDQRLRVRASLVNSEYFEFGDLRRYNVLVVPDGGGEFVRAHVDGLKSWVEAGGTLIAIGSSAAALAREGGIGAARLLPDVLDKLEEYHLRLIREWQGLRAAVDVDAVWSNVARGPEYPWQGRAALPVEELRRRDAWQSLFSPQGAIVATRVDDESWLTFGCDEVLPMLVRGRTPLMAAGGVEAPVRIGAYVAAAAATSPAGDSSASAASADGAWGYCPAGYELVVRISGLLWPEAVDRLAHCACLTRERVGSGQVILFADSPAFRAGTPGAARLLSNAMIYGPGLGASAPILP